MTSCAALRDTQLRSFKPLMLSAAIMMLFSINDASADPSAPIPIPRAAITPNELALIIAKDDPLSEAIGAYYQTARGIPASNIIRVTLPNTSQDSISLANFNAIKAQVDQALPANIQATLLTWTHPFKVDGGCSMSITSAFALGYSTQYCLDGTLTKPTLYYDSNSTHPWQDFGLRPSMMLGAYTLDSAKTLIDRGIHSDSTYPTGDGYLLRTTDPARSVRYPDFMGLPSYWNFTGGLHLTYIDNANGSGADYIQNTNNVLFYFTGLQSVPYLNSNHFLPGAIGDHLTSYGGVLPPTPAQMPSTQWLEAGATGSYGNVEEPRNYTDKFPRASVVIDQYYRGATLIEAYWKSVRSPGEGLFLGEPLARPFADQASSTIEAGQFVIKTRNLRVTSAGSYYIESRNSVNEDWMPLSGVWLDKPKYVELHSPIPTNPSAEVKLVGACPDAHVNVKSAQFVTVQGGQSQRVTFELQLANTASTQSDCNQSISLTTPTLADGLQASLLSGVQIISPSPILLKPQQNINITLAIDVPANIGLTSNAYYTIPPLTITDNAVLRIYNANVNLQLGVYSAIGDGGNSADGDVPIAPIWLLFEGLGVVWIVSRLKMKA